MRWFIPLGLATLAFAALIPSLEIRTDGSALNPIGSESVLFTEADREAFHEREQVLVLISARGDGPLLESREGFRALVALHDQLESMPELGSASVQSLANLEDIVADPERLDVGELLAVVPDDPEAFERLRRRIRRHPLASGLMLGTGGRTAALHIHLDESIERGASLAEIQRSIEAHPLEDFEVRLTGPVVAEVLLGEMVLRELSWQVPVMLGVIALLLFRSLGTLGGVIVPLFEALVVLVWSFGAMAALSVPVTLVTTILPVILMAISITDEIHLLERVQAHLAEASRTGGAAVDRGAVRASLQAGLEGVGRPIVLTSLTTALGFLSFLTASIAPLRSFGIFTALGILLAMLLTFSLIPALLLLLPPTWFLRSSPRVLGAEGPLPFFERIVLARTRFCLGLGCGLVLLALPGIARLEIQDSWIDNFAQDSPLVLAERTFNRDFWGSYRLDVVAAGRREHFANPEGVALVEAIGEMVADAPQVGGVLHYGVPLAQVAESLDLSGPISSLTRRQIADLDTLLDFTSRSDADLKLLAEQKSMARALIYVKSANYQRGSELVALLEAGLAGAPAAADVEIHFSGDIPVALDVVRAIVVNQLRSIGLTVAGVGLILLISSRSGRTLGLALLPVLAALLILFGGMGYAGMSLGIATSMFASLTVGIGVDFALHFQHAYGIARRREPDHVRALRATLQGAGTALRWNVGVLALGFSVLMLSTLGPNRALGVLLAAAMLVCYATTLLLLPQLLLHLSAASRNAREV